jgi:hypothetical protein
MNDPKNENPRTGQGHEWSGKADSKVNDDNQKDKSSLHTPGLICVHISHDEWCNQLTHGGECNCNPDVDLRRFPNVPEWVNL